MGLIAKEPEKYGVKVLHHDYDRYLQATKDTAEPVIETEWLSKEGIKNLCRRARLEWQRN